MYSAAVKSDFVIEGVAKTTAGIKTQGRCVVETPMCSQIQQNARGKFVDDCFGLFAGPGLDSVAVGEPIEQVRPELNPFPAEQRFVAGARRSGEHVSLIWGHGVKDRLRLTVFNRWRGEDVLGCCA